MFATQVAPSFRYPVQKPLVQATVPLVLVETIQSLFDVQLSLGPYYGPGSAQVPGGVAVYALFIGVQKSPSGHSLRLYASFSNT